MDQKQKVLDFLKTQKEMVIATESNSIPEAALMGFCEYDNLNLMFGTDTTTRKFQNIQNNSRVAIVFGHSDGITVQYEGIVSIIIGTEIEEYKKKYFEKQPQAKKYETDPNQVYLKVMPIWIRYTDYNKEPEEIFEFTP